MRKKILSVVALFCILAYTGAVVFAAYRAYQGIERQRETAGIEVDDIAGLISQNSAGLFEEAGRKQIQDKVNAGRALAGIIITGSIGSEFAFEKEPGKTIVWNGDTPGFTRRLGVAYLPAKQVDVQDLRNVNIYPAYNTVDYVYFAGILKQSLSVILAALLVAFLTLIISSTIGRENAAVPAADGREPEGPGEQDSPPDAHEGSSERSSPEEDGFDFTDFSDPPTESGDGETGDYRIPGFDETPADEENNPGGFGDFVLGDFLDENELTMPGEEPPIEGSTESSIEGSTGPAESTGSTGAAPQGLYSPESGIGWESYTMDRLASELHRCASSEQDLVILLFECGEDAVMDEDSYRKLAGEAVHFFNLKDLTFEKGNRGISIIIPHADLDHGIEKAEEFHAKVLKTLPENFTAKTSLRAGLSSRSGRLIDAGRLFFEASSALEKARSGQPIVAFKSNPEKYREFIKKSQT
ncbi:MAG: hypothetical protein LBI67_06505 [Treponema sp.]|jgi:hypothetical protein|nr:hypothetical protein [Treponema sp.]